MSRRAVRDGTLQAGFTLEFKAGEGSTLTYDNGDEEDFRSLLLDFRSFVAPNEDVNLNGILNILELMLPDGDLKQDARNAREAWKRAQNGVMGLLVNGKSYTALVCFDLMTKGFIFHDDPALAAEWKGLDPFLQGMVEQKMILMVADGIRVLWPVRNIIRAALESGLLDQSSD